MKKAAKIFLWIVLIFFLLFIGLYFGSQPLLKGIMDKKLKDMRIAGLYKIQTKTAYFDLLNLGISLKDVSLTPDSTTKAFKLSPQIAQLQIKRVSLSYVDPFKLILDNKLKVGKIKIIQPSLDLYFLNRKALNSNEVSDTSNTIIDLDGFEIKKMKVQLFLKNGNSIIIKRLNFNMDKPRIQTQLFPELNKALTYKNLEINCNDITYTDSKSTYNLSLGDIEIGENFKKIIIKDFKMDPKYDKKTFASKYPYQIDQFVVDLDQMEIQNLDLERLINNNVLSIQNIDINGLNMEVFRDKSYPLNVNNFPKLPQQQIRGIKQQIEIQNINVKSANIIYLEKLDEDSKVGRVDFKNLQAQISHFGNTKNWIQNEEFRINAQTNIYDKVPLFTQMNFPLGSNTFYISGQVKKSPMHYFNAFTVSNAGIEIEDGNIDRMEFNFKANTKTSSGELSLLYNSLKIKILKEKETGEIKKRKFFNFVVNSILLPKQNPNKKGEEYHGIIAFERDINKGVFNYLWKSVFSGIKDTFLKENKDIQDYTLEKEETNYRRKEIRQQKRNKRKK